MGTINYLGEAQKEIDSLSSLFSKYVEKKELKEEHGPRIMLFSSLSTKVSAIYKSLNLSALAGEYVYDEEFEGRLTKLKETLLASATEIPESDKYIEESKTVYCFTSIIKRDLDSYYRQIHYFNNSLTKPNKVLINDDDLTSSEFNINEPILGLTNHSKLFRLNIRLLTIDREFILLHSTFSRINRISHEISELKHEIDEPYVDALLHKCSVLENKFYYCKDNSPYLSYYNYYNGKDEDVDLKLDGIGLISKRISEIYTTDKQKYETNISTLFSNFSQLSTTFQFFVACHYYKNIAHDENSLKSIEDKFRKIIPTKTLLFDRTNAFTCLSYLRNCRFSLQLEGANITIENVESELTNVISVQKQSGINNYFPYYKAARWYKTRIDAILSNSEKKNARLNEYITNYENHINQALVCLDSRARIVSSYIPYKPQFDECIETYKDIDIFISTSFIVPVDIRWIYVELKKLESDLSRVKAIADAKSLVNSVSSVKTDCDNAINKLKDETSSDLKENLKNSIQILSIFAGIVIFASGSIQIFSSAISIKQAAIFMVMFAAALGLVGVFVRNCLVSREKWNIRDWVYIIFLVFICIITGFGTFGSWGKDDSVSTLTSTPNPTQQVSNTISHINDSLSIHLLSDPIKVEISTEFRNNKDSTTKQMSK